MTERLFLRLDGDPLYAPETGVPAGAMREFAVCAPLREHVSHIAMCREIIPDGAVAAVLGVPAGEIAGSAVSLDKLWRGEAGELVQQMAAAPDDAARVAMLQAALQRRRGDRDNSARRQAMHAARLIAESGGRHPLRAVADVIGVGERRLQQIFHAQVGLSPRAWSRLARLHACLRALRQKSAPRWSEVAVDTGFYDQSHLVNEFQSLCGLTPGLFLERAVSGSSKTVG